MGKPSYLHTATLLKNGMVLIAGGVDPGNGPGTIADTELCNPEAGTFVATGKLQLACYRPTALLLNTGAVLVAEGADEKGYLGSAELYNPTTQTFTFTGGLRVARLGHKLALLKDGMVLVVGGQGDGVPWPPQNCTIPWRALSQLRDRRPLNRILGTLAYISYSLICITLLWLRANS